MTARYHMAGALAAVGRHADAIAAFEEVSRQAGAERFYGRMARMGRPTRRSAPGNSTPPSRALKELAAQQADELPVDALLMEIGLAYRAKGDTAEAQKTLTQMVEQHPNSPYAPQARAALDTLSGS